MVAEAEAEAEEPPLRGLDSVDAVVSQPIKARRGSSVEASKELGEVAPLLNDTEEEDEGEDEDGGSNKLEEFEAATPPVALLTMTPTVSRILALEIG